MNCTAVSTSAVKMCLYYSLDIDPGADTYRWENDSNRHYFDLTSAWGILLSLQLYSYYTSDTKCWVGDGTAG